MHTPWSEQSFGHTFSRSHIGPSNPSAHRQVATPDGASTHTPRPEQSAAHGVTARFVGGVGSAHAGPCHPGAQTHAAPVARAWEHTPWPEHASGHGSTRRQLSPENPGTHSHAPPRQTPAPEQSSGQMETTPLPLTTPLQSAPSAPAAQTHCPRSHTP